MKRTWQLIRAWAIALPLALSGVIAFSNTAQAQRSRGGSRAVAISRVAFEKGYAAGYQDGFAVGRNDFRVRRNQDFRADDHYQRADRGYRNNYGGMTDYQDGYRLGFEMAYVDGYYGRTYSSRMPLNAVALRASSPDTASDDRTRPSASTYIPNGTVMTLRLRDTLSTKNSNQGDRFTADVLNPRAYEGATVTGHVASITRSGRVTGKTEMALAFDSITLRNGRSGPLHGQVESIRESDAVKSVDEEGNIESASKGRDTAIRGGGGAALGAIIGAIAGGGKGAAIGALLGAGVGAGSVYVQGKKDLILEPGAEITIRTAASRNTRR
ncbi:MAG: hypothetical protein ABI977_28300 [Acidobacteriota bacterium]